jgi:hypothetical protein
VEWMGREVLRHWNGEEFAWLHVHADDEKRWVHRTGFICKMDEMQVDQESNCAWVFSKDTLHALRTDLGYAMTVERLAEEYPEAIYFYADTVTHPEAK